MPPRAANRRNRVRRQQLYSYVLAPLLFGRVQFSPKSLPLRARRQLAPFSASVPRLTWPPRQRHDIVITSRQIPDATDRFGFFFLGHSPMSWMTWVAVLVAWPLIGMGVAYLFGCLVSAGQAPGDDPIPQ